MVVAGKIINGKTKYKKTGFCISLFGGLMAAPILIFVAFLFYKWLYTSQGLFLPALSILLGILSIVAGTIINKKTKYKKIGSCISAAGGLLIVPIVYYIIFGIIFGFPMFASIISYFFI